MAAKHVIQQFTLQVS